VADVHDDDDVCRDGDVVRRVDLANAEGRCLIARVGVGPGVPLQRTAAVGDTGSMAMPDAAEEPTGGRVVHGSEKSHMGTVTDLRRPCSPRRIADPLKRLCGAICRRTRAEERALAELRRDMT
jgi:hypothetical protein